MKSTKEKVTDIKSKVKMCADVRKGANSVIDILCYCQDDEPSVVRAAVQGLLQLFTHFYANGDMTKTPEKEDVACRQLCTWLQEQYSMACDTILEKLDSPEHKLREAALVAMVKFVEMEGKHPLQQPKANQFSFPEKLLQGVVSKLLSRSEDQESLIVRLSELTEYDDFRFFLMKALKQNLGKTPVKERSEAYLANVLVLVYNLQVPQGDTDLAANYLTAPDGEEVSHPKLTLVKEHKKLFTACLMEFLRSELTPSLYRRVLTKLDDKVLPCLSSPLLLADFLTDSYNVGGAISLLALNGLFILVHKYNLDYPDFYRKFYSLLQPQIFQAKYCARFFHLADIFLSSTHLPSYLVAAFIKRIARLALTAPPAGARLSIVFVCNLMVRHPSCGVLAHRPNHTCETDPFVADLDDPINSCAMDSSLWEIKTLQSHYSPEVAQEAMKINHAIKQEQIIADFLDDSTEQIIERVVKKRKAVNVPIRPEKPTCLFDSHFKCFFSVE